MSRTVPEFWIDDVTSKDYELMMAGDTVLDTPSSLINHALVSPSPNSSDVVTRRKHKKRLGKIFEEEVVLRTAQQLSQTFTVITGPVVESPILRAARDEPGCEQTLFLMYLCPENDNENHCYIYDKGKTSEPVRVNDPYPIDETTLAQWQMEFRIIRELLLKETVIFKGAIEANTDPLYAVAFMTQDCVNCGDARNESLLATGGDGTSAMVILKSTDRLQTLTAKTATAPAGSVGTSIWTSGDIALIGFSDLDKTQYGETTEPASGGTQYSVDGGDTWTIDTDVSVPVMGVTSFLGQLLACGGAGGGAAWLAESDNGISWTQITNASFPADEAFVDIAVDEVNEVFYVVTQAGTIFKGFYQGDNFAFASLTLPATIPAKVFSVEVDEDNRVRVGGASGYLAESLDGGVTWSVVATAGTNNLLSHKGKRWRSLLGNGAALQERSPLPYSNSNFVTRALANGQTTSGNVTGVAKTTDNEDDYSYWAYVTDAGETAFIRDNSPFS